MESVKGLEWNSELRDPSGRRSAKPRHHGLTMVIDKGLGVTAFQDMLQASGAYIDMIKLGFGTSALYPEEVLQHKIRLCREHKITIMPGGTFLEAAVVRDMIEDFFAFVCQVGFDGIEVSDGTIQMDVKLREELIIRGKACGLKVFTEYGKKFWGSRVEIDDLIRTIHEDLRHGSELITIEGRESGKGVGIYDEQGKCDNDTIAEIVSHLPNPHVLLCEAPLKSQQAELINRLGPDANLGNIPPSDILSLEALRRGLRSDTLSLLLS